MFEKVNPSHPDKIADRIAGAIVDLAYTKDENPTVAVEVLIGHGNCNVIIESSEKFTYGEVSNIVKRLTDSETVLNLVCVPQDVHLSNNQAREIRCGDNGIFKGVPVTSEEVNLSNIATIIYSEFPSDGKYIIDDDKLIVCQSNASTQAITKLVSKYGYDNVVVNPLGDWTGGTQVDSGATNRKLGSDMAQSVTGGGLHGKDGKTKADVCCNVWAFKKAQETGKVVQLCCAIGDAEVTGYIGDEKISIPFKEISEFGHYYIMSLGGYEKFAEWGLV